MSAPHFLQTLNFEFPSIRWLVRVALPHLGQINCALETSTDLSLLTICPFWPWRLARWCFLTKLSPSTTTFPVLGKTNKTLPVLPRSLPESIITLSPFLIFIVPVPRLPCLLAPPPLARPSFPVLLLQRQYNFGWQCRQIN